MNILDSLNILPIQESVDGWMLTSQSTQRGENRASTVHESGSNMEEDSQVEVDEDVYIGVNEDEEAEQFIFAEIPADLNNIDNEVPNHVNVAEPEDGQIELQFPETPPDLDNTDNQVPSELVQSVDSGRQTSDQEATQNIDENYANVERRVAEPEDGQIEPGQIHGQVLPVVWEQDPNIIVPVIFIFDEHGNLSDEQSMFPGIPPDLNEIHPPIHKNGHHTAERRLTQNNENDANADSSVAVLEDGQFEHQLDEECYTADDEGEG